jgi:hypothetical protein
VTVDRTYLFTYVVPTIAAFVLAAGIGGAVLGAYAPLQQNTGLCGESEFTVFPPGEGGPSPTVADSGVFPVFGFDELSEEEKRAFREALASPINAAEISGETEHAGAFGTGVESGTGADDAEDGAVVRYEGEAYFVASVPHDCTNVAPLILPLSLVGLLVGTAGMLTPIVWRRRIGRPLHGGDSPTRSALSMFRDGPYEGIGLVGSFGAGAVVSIIPLIGPLLGGSIVGVVAPSTRRAAVLGTYLGVLVAGILAVSTAFGILPDTLAILARLIVSVVPALTPSPLVIAAVVVLAPVVLAPIAAAATRWGTDPF